MNAADALANLAQIATWDDPPTRFDAAAALARQLGLEGADELTVRAFQRDAKERGLLTLSDSRALVREGRQLASSGGDGNARVPYSPDGMREVPGSPGWAYRPATATDPGAVYTLRGKPAHWHEVLPWVPGVARVLESGNDVGDTTARYFEVTAGGRAVIASADELNTAEPWQLLPVPGTGAKRVREVLVNVVQAQAADVEPEPALSRTGWHERGGRRVYVFADGRTSEGGERVRLIGPSRAMAQLAAAAAPVEPAPSADVAAALATIAGRGRGVALAGLGIGVRSLGQSLHKVLGGYVFAGNPNAGKTNAGWTARTLLIARPGRANAWPPLPSATFADTAAYVEGVFDTEADMPALFDDAAVYAGSTRAAENAVAELLEKTYRPLANDAPIKGRSSQTMLPRPSHYVRSPVISTVQDAPMQNSLRRRVLILPVEHGDVDVNWYRGPVEHPGTNAAALVRPLRTLGEHVVIPYLAQLADAPGYLAAKDGEALAALTGRLDAELPGWQSSSEGLAGVAELAACALAGLLIVADALPELRAEVIAEPAVSYLVRAVAAQAGLMADAATVEAPGPALADVIRAALLNGRAHVCDEHGVPSPQLDGLSAQEHGLERIPGKFTTAGDPEYRGRGVPLYHLPELDGLGVSSANLHKLVTDAADPRLRSRGVLALPGQLADAGVIVPNDKSGPSTTHQHWVNGGKVRLVVIRAEVVYARDDIDDAVSEPGRPGRPGRSQAEAEESNAEPAEGASEPGRPQVRAEIADAGRAPADVPISAPDVGPTTPTTFPGRNLVAAHCSACPEPLDAALVALGETTHPACDPGPPLDAEGLAAAGWDALAGALAEADGAAPGEPSAEHEADADSAPLRPGVRAHVLDSRAPTAPCPQCGGPTVIGSRRDAPTRCTACRAAELGAALATVAAGPVQARSSASHVAPPGTAPTRGPVDQSPGSAPARPTASASARERGPAFLVWDGGEVAHAPEGELVPVPPGALTDCRNVGDVAALALALGARRLWLTRAAREALGLPAELPETGSPREGVPHPFVTGADPERWDIWPAEPLGLGAWMTIHTLPRPGERVVIAFAEWLDAPDLDGPSFAELAPAELAHALTLIWRSTTFEGNGGRYGGVHFHHSPQATFKQLVAVRMRRSGRGIPDAPSLPPIYAEAARTRGARLIIPGPHMAPAQEVPIGWIVAALDVNSCYPAAARSTEFPVGAWQEVRPGRLDKAPGIHLCAVPAEAAAIHPALMPWFPAPKRGQREVRAWLDGLAALWLAERGVPLRPDVSYLWPEPDGRRVFDSPIREVLAARDQLAALDGAPARLARDVIKAGYARFLGGWLGSDAWERRAGDWTDNRAWWLRVRVQAEVRKQRNLVPMLGAGALVLGQAQVDTVWLAAPSLDALAGMPGTGKRPALGDGPGKFKLAGHAAVTPELAAQLADTRAPDHARRDAIRAALDAGRSDHE
jgi:hypothetical protein